MSIRVSEDGTILRDGESGLKTPPTGETPPQGRYQSEIISLENLKAHGIQIPSAEQLKLRFKPVALVSFINTADATDRVDLLCRRIDQLTYTQLADPAFINYIAKLVEIQQTVATQSTEDVDLEAVMAALDPDKLLESKFQEDMVTYAVASHCIVAPRIPIRQILFTLPLSFVRVVSEFCVGGVGEFDELAEGFHIQIKYL